MVLLAAAVLVLMLQLMVAVAAPMGLLPHCQTKCGKLTVPYPFGFGSSCSLLGFNVTCDHTHKTPRLLLGNGSSGIQVTKILLDKAIVYVKVGAIVNITSELMHKHMVKNSWGTPGSGGGDGPFFLSYRQNKFIAMGCNIQANLFARRSDGTRQLITGCSSFCAVDGDNNEVIWDPMDAKGHHCHLCSGNGCCQSKIPLYNTSYEILLKKVEAEKNVQYVDPVMHNLVLIGEQGWIERAWCWMLRNTTVPDKKTRKKLQHLDLSMVPVVLVWPMNSTVPAQPGKAADNASRCPTEKPMSVCKSKLSSCVDINTPFRSGYACRCNTGYNGNPYLVDGCQGRIIGLGVASGATFLALALSTVVVIRHIKTLRKKKIRQRFFKQNRGQLLQQLVSQMADISERMIITLDELEKATNNFDKSRELGGGGHGTVYKGILSSQHVVAIKKSKIVIQREINEFINEVAILSQVNHRNIVKLHGCCLETEVPLLVYEFISNGTLYDHLHVEALVSLSWKDRLRITVEISRALAYLHSFVSMPIIHRDIKSPNILLDENLTVKLSDFGASRYIPINKEEIHTTVQGTVGYLDPMYNNTGLLTEKSDVYSFGVLLIELLTKRKPVSYRSSQGFGLANHFVSLLLEGSIDQLLDPQVSREGDGEVVDICLLAAMCVKLRAEDRPSIRQVEVTLESIQASKEFYSDMSDDDRFSEGTNYEARSWH
ncbi:hypothetical protein HU200_038252 [Digitaria exilis]|uniref:Protein kinase domain-containing protein n=1 Tax=Digitaria exilis TaxID=1010633 RepID=A0A835BJ06_9POAL|nr:hypothetical protein HU200_038252 [Digitaria exilis]